MLDSLNSITINDIADRIEFIPLEAKSKKAMVGGTNLSLLRSGYDYIVSHNQLSLFGINRFDSLGHFVGSISGRGRSSSEVTMLLGVFGNNNLNKICVRSFRKIVVFSSMGRYLHNIELKESVADIALLNNGTYVYAPFEVTGDVNSAYLKFMDDRGEITDTRTYDKRQNFGNIDQSIESQQNPTIIKEKICLGSNFEGDVLYRDKYSNIIDRIRGEDDIAPYANIALGKFQPVVEDSKSEAKCRQKIYIREIAETQNYFIITYIYNGRVNSSMWDKQEERIIYNTSFSRESKGPEIGYKLFARYQISQTEDTIVNIAHTTESELYCLLTATQASRLLAGVEPDDNPIIMVVHLKSSI
ncbi:MAG: 6-bladed beta-propeller [Rikenellaceae bacterium]